MKFNFVRILCTHALKVLDKKNIKRLPTHYLLKRWTKDSKVCVIKDYRGIDIKGNSQELIGKRYSHLCRNFREISTLSAENKIIYEYVDRYSKKLLKEVQEMRKICHFSGVGDHLVVQGEADNMFQPNEDIASQDIRGIKTTYSWTSQKKVERCTRTVKKC